jgi:hypothetical protein
MMPLSIIPLDSSCMTVRSISHDGSPDGHASILERVKIFLSYCLQHLQCFYCSSVQHWLALRWQYVVWISLGFTSLAWRVTRRSSWFFLMFHNLVTDIDCSWQESGTYNLTDKKARKLVSV